MYNFSANVGSLLSAAQDLLPNFATHKNTHMARVSSRELAWVSWQHSLVAV